ncbi:MAG: hypothetical protein DMF89_17590 [Acidobacteria bacterium]|nr:MAG: hypothetical protein DMF89_17590 [Acidobacteriota bacterium]
MKSVSYGCVVAAVACVFGTPLQAQESTSAALAKELVAALDSSKIDTIAAKDPASPGTYVAALYIPGVELLVVAGDLSGASVAGTKVFVEDLGANGLSARRSENQPFDSFESSGKRTAFDGDWDKQKLSREDYQRIFSAAEARYTQMLTVLIEQIKKGR